MLAPSAESPAFPIFLAAPRVRNELSYRLRQQSLFDEFSRAALRTRDFKTILQRVTKLCARWLGARFAMALEFLPDENRLMACASLGWNPNPVETSRLQRTTDRRPDMPIEPARLSYPIICSRKHASKCRVFWRVMASCGRLMW